MVAKVVRESGRPEVGAIGEVRGPVLPPAKSATGRAEPPDGDGARLEVCDHGVAFPRIPGIIDQVVRIREVRLVSASPEPNARGAPTFYPSGLIHGALPATARVRKRAGGHHYGDGEDRGGSQKAARRDAAVEIDVQHQVPDEGGHGDEWPSDCERHRGRSTQQIRLRARTAPPRYTKNSTVMPRPLRTVASQRMPLDTRW